MFKKKFHEKAMRCQKGEFSNKLVFFKASKQDITKIASILNQNV